MCEAFTVVEAGVATSLTYFEMGTLACVLVIPPGRPGRAGVKSAWAAGWMR